MKMIFGLVYYGMVIVALYGMISIIMKVTTTVSPLDNTGTMDTAVMVKQSVQFIVSMLFRFAVQCLIGTGLMQYVIVAVIVSILGFLVLRRTMKMVFNLVFYGMVIITFYRLIC